MKDKVIHISEVLKIMNAALMNNSTVSFKAWKVGNGDDDPERGMIKAYDHVYVTSHSRTGTYITLDPLAENKKYKYRRVSEALICEFMDKKVIW